MTDSGPAMPDAQRSDVVNDPSRSTFDVLWQAAFNTYYDCYYNETVADRLVGRWLLVDDLAKLSVAFTASGSALSGWATWSQPGYKIVWATFAGLAAVVAIVHTTLTVAHRLRDWGEIKRAFASLRLDLETFRYRMRFDTAANEAELQSEFLQYRRRYQDVVQRLRNDSMITRALKIAAQKDVDRRIAKDLIGDAHHGTK